MELELTAGSDLLAGWMRLLIEGCCMAMESEEWSDGVENHGLVGLAG